MGFAHRPEIERGIGADAFVKGRVAQGDTGFDGPVAGNRPGVDQAGDRRGNHAGVDAQTPSRSQSLENRALQAADAEL